MTRREALPPRAAEWVLEWALPPAEGREIAQDLRELFAHRLRERGSRSARLWYWKQVAIFIRRAGVFRRETGLEADSLRADVAYALRSLRRAPGFTVMAVVTLALGMGANIATWSVVHHVVLQPLGYDAGERLVSVWPEHHFTRKRFETFRDRTISFETLSSYAATGLTLTGEGEPGLVRGLLVSHEHFDVFGRKPLLGRGFALSDGTPGAEPVVIISHGMWQERFGGLIDVLGQRIELEERRTIIGVAAPGFEPLGSVTDVWVPLVFDPDDVEYTHMANLKLVAVLREGTSSESARAELEGLLLKSFWRLQNVDTGFRSEAVVSIRVSPGSFRYPEEAQRVQYYRDVFEALRQLPGVTNVGAIQILPMTSQSMAVGYSPTGEPLPAAVAPPMVSYRVVTPDYRRSLGIPLLEGRDLDAFDRSGSTPVGLINEVLARELSPGESFLGREFKYENGEAWFTVVGVVGNVRQHRLDHEARPEVSVPLAQDAWPDSIMLVLRTTAASTERYPLFREAIWSVDGNVPITQMRSMQDVVESSMSEPRLRTSLFAGFALLAFVLSAVGIYGVMSYTVKERTHDIGIRMALGASRRHILRETLLEGMRPVLAGMGLGLLLSLFATRALTGFLFEVEGTDPAVYAVVACLLGGVAMAAGFVPAQRASQSDPLEVLNAEN